MRASNPWSKSSDHLGTLAKRIVRAILAGVVIGAASPSSRSAKLEPYATIASFDIQECSGIVKSRQSPNLYWVHNDSSRGSRVFGIRRDGSLVASFPTHLPNTDWEDIATDNAGNLYLGDFGNFHNTRRDLAIHVLKEPVSTEASSDIFGTSHRFAYPDQIEFPPARRIYDCEALFWARGELFLLTKSLGDTYTRLYCFESLEADSVNRPTLVGSFDIGPQVTAADATSDGKMLAVLTTRSVWVFERPANSRNYLDGKASMRRIQAGQCEAICWDDDDTLIIANEGRELFELHTDDLVEY